MTDVRLTAVNPEDSQVYPVACNDKGELLLESTSGDFDVPGNLTVGPGPGATVSSDGSATFAGGDVTVNSLGNLYVGTTTGWFSRRFVAEYDNSAAAFVNSNVGSAPISVVNTAADGNNELVSFFTDSRSAPQQRGDIDFNRSVGQIRYNVTSDMRLKSNIQPAGSAAELLSSVQVRTYVWPETGQRIDYGFVAQELYECCPDAVKVGDVGDEISDTWAVDHSKLVPMLTKALQEAFTKIGILEAQVAALEAP